MTDVTSPVPGPIQTLLQVFEEHLGQVNFPDVNATVLREASQAVVDAHAQVTRLEAELALARQSLAERQDQLLGRAQRALAYARIFAEEQPELLARLDVVSLPRPPRRTPKVEAVETPVTPSPRAEAEAAPARRKPGRPARARPAGMLFQEDGSAEAENASAPA